VLRTFQDALPFVEETDLLLKHWEFCYERSIGCVGNFRLMLVRAVRAALWADAKTLRWNDLKTHAFSEAESYEMMREAYEGERELASLLQAMEAPSNEREGLEHQQWVAKVVGKLLAGASHLPGSPRKEQIAAMTSDEGTPSVDELARQMGYGRNIFRTNVPDLCKQVSERRSAARREHHTERMATLCHEIRQAAFHLHRQGTYPSKRQVSKQLSDLQAMRAREAYEAWRLTLEELGYPTGHLKKYI
jgi:hypothetical protein